MDNAIAKSSCLIFAISGIYSFYVLPTFAQVIPDNTLGNENSVVALVPLARAVSTHTR